MATTHHPLLPRNYTSSFLQSLPSLCPNTTHTDPYCSPVSRRCHSSHQPDLGRISQTTPSLPFAYPLNNLYAPSASPLPHQPIGSPHHIPSRCSSHCNTSVLMSCLYHFRTDEVLDNHLFT
ncbi:hypothetical protein C8Q70DRAFT_1040556 [Cubamyces menziesii]|nr:hypothetical protein C8Q70DRAFT_1040556 [Cubamyces menziesii]